MKFFIRPRPVDELTKQLDREDLSGEAKMDLLRKIVPVNLPVDDDMDMDDEDDGEEEEDEDDDGDEEETRKVQGDEEETGVVKRPPQATVEVEPVCKMTRTGEEPSHQSGEVQKSKSPLV